MKHRWGAREPKAEKTERECTRGCGTIKVTFHRGGRHWTEFCRDGEKFEGRGTPVCEPVRSLT